MDADLKHRDTTAETSVANTAPREGRRLPSWLISTLIHVGLLLCLALFQLTVLSEREDPCSFTALAPNESVDPKTVESDDGLFGAYGLSILAEDSDVSDFESAFGEDSQFVEDAAENDAPTETATVAEEGSAENGGSLLAEENSQEAAPQEAELTGESKLATESTRTAEAELAENQEPQVQESAHRVADPNWFRSLLTAGDASAQSADVSSTPIFHFAAKKSPVWSHAEVSSLTQTVALYSPFQTGLVLKFTGWAAVVRSDLSARCAIVIGFSHDVAQFLRHYGGEPWG